METSKVRSLDPAGITGPTRGQARSRRWQRVGKGVYLDLFADADSGAGGSPGIRIEAQACRLSQRGAISGWASLWWQGAEFCHGWGPVGGSLADVSPRPVPLLDARQLRSGLGGFAQRADLDRVEATQLRGIRCTTPERALLDEARLLTRCSEDPLRDLVVAIDMAAHARLTTPARVRRFMAGQPRARGRTLLLRAVELADEHSCSPPETRLRLVWTLDAGLPAPQCNRRILAADGRLLAVPDLLCVNAGLAVEYDGSHHFTHHQRQRDVHREERLRMVGLDYLTVLAGDLHRRGALADRLIGAYRRGLARSRTQEWRVGRFQSERDGYTLDQHLDRRDRLAQE
jgi:hypothetical protein